MLEQFTKRRHLKKKMKVIGMKIIDLEFLRWQLKSMREGFRMQHDRLKEELDAMKRRLAGEKYQFFYCASNDEISYKAIPILPDDFERLPDKPQDTKEFRFYKKTRKEVNQQLCTNLTGMIQRHGDDLTQLVKQMEGVDGQVEGPQGVNEKIDGYKTAINLIKEYLTLQEI